MAAVPATAARLGYKRAAKAVLRSTARSAPVTFQHVQRSRGSGPPPDRIAARPIPKGARRSSIAQLRSGQGRQIARLHNLRRKLPESRAVHTIFRARGRRHRRHIAVIFQMHSVWSDGAERWSRSSSHVSSAMRVPA